MNLQNCNYITCYRKQGEYIYVYFDNGSKCRCFIGHYCGRYYLNILCEFNDFLFYIFDIDKEVLISKFPGKYFNGYWPESRTEKDVFILLREIIKESKKKYALKTEL